MNLRWPWDRLTVGDADRTNATVVLTERGGMSDILDETVQGLLAAGNGEPSPLLREMTEYGRERGFPIVGPAVGRFLRVAATMAGAERVFEFGSGFGYSAAWVAPALPVDGEIHLTDFDEDNLATAREFLERGEHAATASYHVGDAMESFEAVDGAFDFVLVDHDKTLYEAAFERAAPRLRDGGVVVADNMMAGPVEPAAVRATLEGADPEDDTTAGVAAYIEAVREHPDFETVLVPLGQGIAVSVKR